MVERYEYSAYGEPRIYAGGDGESGELLFVSSVGNPYMHQSLRRDDETGLHENRMRVLNPRLGRFMQRDPLEFSDSLNLYEYVESGPFSATDPLGLLIRGGSSIGLPDWVRMLVVSMDPGGSSIDGLLARCATGADPGSNWRFWGKVGAGAAAAGAGIGLLYSWISAKYEQATKNVGTRNNVSNAVRIYISAVNAKRGKYYSLPNTFNKTSEIARVWFIRLDDGRISVIVKFTDGTSIQFYIKDDEAPVYPE